MKITLGILSLFVLMAMPFALFAGNNKEMSEDKINVKIPPTTKVIDEESLRHLSISKEGSVLSFDAITPVIDSLSVGDVIVGGVSKTTPYGLAPRRIVSIKKEGKQIKVITKPATLEEAIDKGTIRTKERKIHK